MAVAPCSTRNQCHLGNGVRRREGRLGIIVSEQRRDEGQYRVYRPVECHLSFPLGQLGPPQSILAQEPGDPHIASVADGLHQ